MKMIASVFIKHFVISLFLSNRVNFISVNYFSLLVFNEQKQKNMGTTSRNKRAAYSGDRSREESGKFSFRTDDWIQNLGNLPMVKGKQDRVNSCSKGHIWEAEDLVPSPGLLLALHLTLYKVFYLLEHHSHI